MRSRFTIAIQCPRCGRIDLTCDEVTFVVNPHQGSAHYPFDCVGCAHQVVKAVPPTVKTAMSLLSISVWTVPAEVPERELAFDHQCPALTVDDLLDTILWLRDHEDLSETDLPTQWLVES